MVRNWGVGSPGSKAMHSKEILEFMGASILRCLTGVHTYK